MGTRQLFPPLWSFFFYKACACLLAFPSRGWLTSLLLHIIDVPFLRYRCFQCFLDLVQRWCQKVAKRKVKQKLSGIWRWWTPWLMKASELHFMEFQLSYLYTSLKIMCNLLIWNWFHNCRIGQYQPKAYDWISNHAYS